MNNNDSGKGYNVNRTLFDRTYIIILNLNMNNFKYLLLYIVEPKINQMRIQIYKLYCNLNN